MERRSGEIGHSKKQHRTERDSKPWTDIQPRMAPFSVSLLHPPLSDSIRTGLKDTSPLTQTLSPARTAIYKMQGSLERRISGIKVINPKRTEIGVFDFKLRKPRYCPCGPELTEAPVPQQLLFSGALCNGVQAEVQDLFFIESSSSMKVAKGSPS